MNVSRKLEDSEKHDCKRKTLILNTLTMQNNTARYGKMSFLSFTLKRLFKSQGINHPLPKGILNGATS